MKKFLSVLLLLCMLLSMLPGTAVAYGYDPIVRIGLQYDSGAMVAANLQNVTGMSVGYMFGYFDSNRQFVPNFTLEGENAITILKNAPLWRDGKEYYEEFLYGADEEMGAYCLQINSFFELDYALQLCRQLQSQGLKAYPCAVQEGFRVRIGTYPNMQTAEQQLSYLCAVIGYPLQLRGPSSTGYTIVRTGTCEVLYQFDMLGEHPLGIYPNSQQTWFKGYKYYGGFEYNRIGGGNMNVINYVGLSDYVKGVIPYEMSPTWPVEALKAQALCAKSYTVNNLGKHGSKGFDLCNTTDCQVYRGTSKASHVTDGAVDAVAGRFVMYNGKICQTYYHASSGGYTEDVSNIWGKDIPYLKAVEDKYLEDTRPFTETLTLDDITWILQEKGFITQQVTDMYVSKYSPVGNVLALTVKLSDGSTKTFTGDRARTALNSQTLGITIGSHRYTINGNRAEETISVNGAPTGISGLYAQGGGYMPQTVNVSQGLVALTANGVEAVTITKPEQSYTPAGQYVITGTGSGHNIGLSQEGARSMANMGFTAEQICEFYFTGAKVDYYLGN